MRSGISQRKSRPYRRYRPLPALLVIGLLVGVSGFVWIKVLEDASDVDEAVRCSPPASAPPGETYDSVGHDALDDVQPIPPDKVSFTVLNASGARGQAALTTEELKQVGFTNAESPENDSAYEDRTANCRGQLRFGENGEEAARTLSLVNSCVELIKDGRKDATVDLSIGGDFGEVRPSSDAMAVLDQLEQRSKERSGQGNSELSDNDAGAGIDEDLLDSARTTNC